MVIRESGVTNMCIIVYKPKDIEFPSWATLEKCFKSNSDGAGYMYSDGERVHIRKGFMNWKSLKKSLKATKKLVGDKEPFVLHFRIGTQGGNVQSNCHPFPLSKSMEDLRLLGCNCEIGVAHNGIISLTSTYSKNVDYSDTMKFITDYLSLIIKSKDYYKSRATLTLIQRLVESKLAILNADGHCELIGDFIEDGGVFYSNSSYRESYVKSSFKWDDYWGWGDTEACYNPYDYGTEVCKDNCPVEQIGDTSFCVDCVDFGRCTDYSKYECCSGDCDNCRASKQCLLLFED